MGLFDDFEHKFEPKSFDDIVFAEQRTRQLLMDLVNGNMPFPIREGKCGILIYGVPGTGKSSLAKLIPSQVELAKGSNAEAGERYERIQPGANGVKLLHQIRNQLHTHPLGYYHYIILDEVDNLTEDAMNILKSLMNYPNTIWVLTTNYRNRLEMGVQDRCYILPFNAAPPQAWLTYAKRVLAHAGVEVQDDNLLIKVIEPCNGSARQITEKIVNVALEARRNQTINSLATT